MRTIVLGPPGTGKTTTLLNKVDHYLKNTDPDKVGYFAFTKKAANEARDRAIRDFNLSRILLCKNKEKKRSTLRRKLGIKKTDLKIDRFFLLYVKIYLS